MHRSAIAALATLPALLGGCVAVSPHEGATPGGISLPLSGTYDARVHSQFTGSLSARLSASPTEDGFTANSRPGVAWAMIGGIEGLLGPLIMPRLFPDGVILYWSSTTPSADGPGEGRLSIGRIDGLAVSTRIHAPDEPIELLAPDGRRLGLITLAPATDPPALPTNYPVLAENINRALRAGLYDPALRTSSQIDAYERGLSRAASIAKDDAEFIFGALAAGRNSVKFLLPLTYRKLDPHMAEAFTGDGALPTLQTTFDRRNRIATIKVDVFLDAEEVDAAFTAALAHSPRAIILDLRSSPGVTPAAFRALSWLMPSPTECGTLFGPGLREQMLSKTPPEATEVILATAQDYRTLEATLRSQGSAALSVLPVTQPFAGPVAVLTGKRTSSSSEALACTLRSRSSTVLVGETTSGRPLISDEFDVGQGWILRAAAYDYTPADGQRFNGKGLTPELKSSSWRARSAARRALLGMLSPPDSDD